MDDTEQKARDLQLNEEFVGIIKDFVQKNHVSEIELIGLCESAKQIAWWAMLDAPVEDTIAKYIKALKERATDGD